MTHLKVKHLPSDYPAPAKEGECGCVPVGIKGKIARYCPEHLKDHISSPAKEGGWEFDPTHEMTQSIKHAMNRANDNRGEPAGFFFDFIQGVEEQAYQRGLVDMKAAAMGVVPKDIHATIRTSRKTGRLTAQERRCIAFNTCRRTTLEALQALDVTKKTI